MKKVKDGENKKILFLFSRYIILLLIAIFLLDYFYQVLLPLTIYPSSFLISIFYHTSVQGSTIIINNIPQIELIEACIASSAYFLLILLSLSVPMKARTRTKSIIFSLVVFLLINIIRIFAFSVLYMNNFKYFDLAHLFVWYFLSGVIVFLVWILTIKVFKITETPCYTDVKFIISKIK